MALTRPDYLVTIAFFLAIATLCLLLSTLSVPFDKSLYVFRLGAWSGGRMRYVDFGVFGYCPVLFDEDKGHGDNPYTMYRCSKSTLGWEIGKDVVDLIMAPDTLPNGLSKSWTSVLVLYPIATIVSFVAFLVTLAVYRLGTISRRTAQQSPAGSGHLKLLSFFTHLALVCTLATFFGHVAILAKMKERVKSLQWANWSLEVKWGNTLLVSLLAWILLFSASVYARKLRKSPSGVITPITPVHDPETGPAQAYEMAPTPITAAPPYKATTSDELIDVGHTEAPPSYAAAVQTHTAITRSSP